MARRIDRVSDNADRLAQRRPLVLFPPADDEIGLLAANLQRAAEVLEQQSREQMAANAALRDYAEQTRDLYDRAPCGYHSLDRDGRFIAINQTELDWLGYTRDEVIGRLTFSDVVTPASREFFAVAFPVMRQTGAVRDVEFELKTKNGRVLPVSVSATAVLDADGAFVASRSSVFDIAKRKAAEEALRRSEARLSAILQTVAEGLLIVSAEGKMSYWNPAAERLLGLNRQAMAGQRLTPDHWQVRDAAGQPLPFDMWPVTRVLRTGEEIVSEQIRVHRADGSEISLSISVAPLRDGEGPVVGAVASFEDATERRLAAETLARAKADAERANLAKSEFLSRMSHDLRTPLNAMLGFAQLLEAEADGEGRRDEIRQILKGGEHLLGLINEVLDIGRIETGQLLLSPEPLSVAELVEHILGLVHPIADQHGVTLVGLGDQFDRTHILADRQRCHQVLLNLLSNAVKYNRPGGWVTVSAVEAPLQRLRIAVTDTGAGVRPEKLAAMFRPFERLGAERTSIEGTGLGLALSKGLVEAMGGTIGIDSVVDQGTTVWVEFPLTAPTLYAVAALSAHPSLAVADPLVRGEVLYIEDNAPNVRLMERLLAKRPGIRLRAVAQGRLGIEQVLAQRPDLVLLDLHLPDLPGEEVLRRLWENPD
ncbi:MAG: PAS domain S-box protein, partial [Vicinamibacteria bacterium]|nr:PAS domain S-box protein [Vicinamibacteria bacterium]